ncbi:MAG: hypothetical protein EZS28_052872 [Streblomastix strix]|uniref:Protein kinase domain-containing protein n=1 Tax=Streblomastix strix TaxID=222440 RepID=A0A5J4RTQ3_9EUKA|nr:MAG: hypothetical protein EZS28_052872 [Streblomastix strix]
MHIIRDYEAFSPFDNDILGNVIQLRQKDTNKQVVIKKFLYISSEKKKIVDDEIAMLILTQSNHIVKFLESFIDGLDMCVVMEFCS